MFLFLLLLLLFLLCFCFYRQRQQQVEFTAKIIATTFQIVLASEHVSESGLQLFPPWTLPAETSAPASPSVSASASIPKHLFPVLHSLSRFPDAAMTRRRRLRLIFRATPSAAGPTPGKRSVRWWLRCAG